jgi:hypothetical protein
VLPATVEGVRSHVSPKKADESAVNAVWIGSHLTKGTAEIVALATGPVAISFVTPDEAGDDDASASTESTQSSGEEEDEAPAAESATFGVSAKLARRLARTRRVETTAGTPIGDIDMLIVSESGHGLLTEVVPVVERADIVPGGDEMWRRALALVAQGATIADGAVSGDPVEVAITEHLADELPEGLAGVEELRSSSGRITSTWPYSAAKGYGCVLVRNPEAVVTKSKGKSSRAKKGSAVASAPVATLYAVGRYSTMLERSMDTLASSVVKSGGKRRTAAPVATDPLRLEGWSEVLTVAAVELNEADTVALESSDEEAMLAVDNLAVVGHLFLLHDNTATPADVDALLSIDISIVLLCDAETEKAAMSSLASLPMPESAPLRVIDAATVRSTRSLVRTLEAAEGIIVVYGAGDDATRARIVSAAATVPDTTVGYIGSVGRDVDALAAAHVPIALGTSTALVRTAATAVLPKNSLADLTTAITLAREQRRNAGGGVATGCVMM